MNSAPTILIIVGITGDLVKRKLLPALGEIASGGMLPKQFHIIGITRKVDISSESLLGGVANKEYLERHLSLFSMDTNNVVEYTRLAEHISEMEKKFLVPVRLIWYLAVPPEVSLPIIQILGASVFAQKPNTKLLLEKPFGVDVISAKELIEQIDLHFRPEQICRVDHFLSKEMTQNLVVFRENNSLFRKTWNKEFIEQIHILASEEIGIEGRVAFYEQTGALRDLIQSHLLELAAIVLMEPTDATAGDTTPLQRLEALRNLFLASDKPMQEYVTRGQYSTYREEVGNPTSMCETYASVTLFSKSPRWEGVPITLTTGKMLDKKVTEIRIFYKKEHEQESNELVIRLHPEAGIFVRLWTKRPGYDKMIEKQMFQFTYKEHYNKWPNGYEQVFFDALYDDQSLCVSKEEVMESWRIVDQIEQAWGKSTEDLIIYEKGAVPFMIENKL